MVRAIRQNRRRWPLVVLALIVVFLTAMSMLSNFYVDLLWFREVNFSNVFWTVLRTKAGLAIVFGTLFFVLLFVNLALVRRLTPKYRVLSPEQEIVERYRLAFEPYLKWLLPLFCAVLAVLVGVGASKEWQTFLLWKHSAGITFGGSDPVFHRDPSFYVFDLPFLQFVQGWLFSSLVGVTVIVGIAHYLWGGIRPQGPGERVSPQVKAHLSVLIGLIVLTKAWGYWLGRFGLLTSPRGVVTGASYTDLHAQLPALNILTIVAVVCAVLFLVNIRLRGWAFPVIGIALLGLVSIVAGGIVPLIVQKFVVAPQELQKEQPYIAYNIAGTRKAFGLDKIQSTTPPVTNDLPISAITGNQTTISNIRLWDPGLLQQNFQQLQRIKQYYEFSDVDVDRYLLDGQERVVMMSAREISQNGIPSGGGSWQNRHLVYTHGYGVTASLVNATSAEGAPLFVISDIPPNGNSSIPGADELAASLNAGQPRVYYGERSDVKYTVVDTGAKELDYQSSADQSQVTDTYQGSGGIPVGGLFQRALFAWRFRDVNLVISSLINSNSRIMINRSIQERVPQAAPFLKFDTDPYAAVIDGHIQWIWDAYTTSDNYPYSQETRLQDSVFEPASDSTLPPLNGSVNYIRNSVKVVVDSYTGKMTYYVADPNDPVIQVWEKSFPGMFHPLSEASPELQAHFRYPENLFQVQATQYANYHVTNPSVFYQKQDFWQIASDPTQSSVVPLRPYYVLTQLPGQPSEEFHLILPYTPQGRQNMVAWMAASSDPAHYGQVVSFEFPAGRNINGPVQVFNQINSDPAFSSQRTLLGQGGSSILFGNFLVIPLGDSFLYVQPVFVQSNQPDSFPELKRVVVVHGGIVGLGATLDEALANSFGGANTQPQTGSQTGGAGGKNIQELTAEALAHFKKADEALRAGDLATYQAEINKAQELVREIGAASLKQPSGGGNGSGGQGAGASQPSATAAPATPSASPASP